MLVGFLVHHNKFDPMVFFPQSVHSTAEVPGPVLQQAHILAQ